MANSPSKKKETEYDDSTVVNVVVRNGPIPLESRLGLLAARRSRGCGGGGQRWVRIEESCCCGSRDVVMAMVRSVEVKVL
jgi:hypothetical protein